MILLVMVLRYNDVVLLVIFLLMIVNIINIDMDILEIVDNDIMRYYWSVYNCNCIDIIDMDIIDNNNIDMDIIDNDIIDMITILLIMKLLITILLLAYYYLIHR